MGRRYCEKGLSGPQVHCGYRRRDQRCGQGVGNSVDRQNPAAVRLQDNGDQDRSLSELRCGHPAAHRARGGMGDRRRGRDRSGPGQLRTSPGDRPAPYEQSDHGADLSHGDRAGAAGGVPRADRSAHSPHHRRDQRACDRSSGRGRHRAGGGGGGRSATTRTCRFSLR